MHEAVDIALVVRICVSGHVAIGALLRLWRIIKRPRALSGNSAGLPVVVFVEAAEPAIIVDRNIEMNFVASGAELRRLIAHEWLQKNAAVRLRIQVDKKIVHRANERDSCWPPVRAIWDIPG